MKKLLVTTLLLLSGTAFAQHHHHHHRYSSWGWAGPAIIGGVIGYEIARQPQPVIVQQYPAPVVVQPSVIYQSPNCTPWVETMSPDGTITRTRTCAQ
jgi:hypothetical protein